MSINIKSVAILFKPAIREQIKASCAERNITLPDDFDTVGQQFNTVLDYSNSAGTVDIVVPSKDDDSEAVAYSYPLADISRVKVVFEQ